MAGEPTERVLRHGNHRIEQLSKTNQRVIEYPLGGVFSFSHREKGDFAKKNTPRSKNHNARTTRPGVK